MMSLVNRAGFEQQFFRKLNAVVEPAVRRGFASPRFLPGGLIVLESIGFKSGQPRSTPLLSFGIGRYRIVSTVRGDKSFWVRNLMQQPKVSYFLGGTRREADAIVLLDGKTASGIPPSMPFLSRLVALLARGAKDGLAVAILVPAKAG
jgi:hypothetical protein